MIDAIFWSFWIQEGETCDLPLLHRLCLCLFVVGHVMSSPHSDQISQGSHVKSSQGGVRPTCELPCLHFDWKNWSTTAARRAASAAAASIYLQLTCDEPPPACIVWYSHSDIEMVRYHRLEKPSKLVCPKCWYTSMGIGLKCSFVFVLCISCPLSRVVSTSE